MPIQNYENFDLLIERTATAYRAHVLAAPAGQASAEFTLPFSAAEQAAVVAANWSTSAARKVKLVLDDTMSATPALDAKAFGSKLFGAIFHADVWTCLTNSLTMTQATGTGLRIRLRLNDATELAMLPWEYLYGPPPYEFFALSEQTPIVRYLALLQGAALLPVTSPLRILVLISDPSDVPTLDVDHEWQRLQGVLAPLQATGKISVERLPARINTLQQRLQQRETPVHILHFIGHGTFDKQQQAGELLFEGASGGHDLVSADRLSQLLYDHQSLRLAFLNACEGSRSGPATLFAGVAQALAQKRLPAVIAMQYSVTDRAAIDLAASFYQAIANGYPVDGALAEARKTLYVNNHHIEWGTPVLFMRAPNGLLFQTQSEQEDAMSEQKENGGQSINTGGGAYIGGGVNTGGGEIIGRDKIIHGDEVRGDKVQGNKTTGDVITANVGAGAKNVAVGKHIRQTITENYGPPTPDDKQMIEQQMAQVKLIVDKLDAAKAQMADFQLKLLQGELTKTADDQTPSASTIMMIGDWLLGNVPQLAQALAELFGMPAVGRVLNKAGEVATAWAKQRFGHKR